MEELSITTTKSDCMSLLNNFEDRENSIWGGFQDPTVKEQCRNLSQ